MKRTPMIARLTRSEALARFASTTETEVEESETRFPNDIWKMSESLAEKVRSEILNRLQDKHGWQWLEARWKWLPGWLRERDETQRNRRWLVEEMERRVQAGIVVAERQAKQVEKEQHA